MRQIHNFSETQSRTKLLENFYPSMRTIQRNNTISTTTDLGYQIPLPPGQCCFLQMSKDQGCFRTHNNIASKGRGGKGGRGIARMLGKMVWECDIFSTVLSKIVDLKIFQLWKSGFFAAGVKMGSNYHILRVKYNTDPQRMGSNGLYLSDSPKHG